MKPSVQVLLVLVCGSAVAFASLGHHCPVTVDLVAKYKLKGERITRGRDEGRPVCPCVDRLLTDLQVEIEVGTGYNKRTQREECWVDKEDNIRFVERCLGRKCEGCSSYPPKRCVPVTSRTTFYAVCVPVSKSFGNLLTGGSRTTAKAFKIRKLTLDLPTCCQCQTFPYGC